MVNNLTASEYQKVITTANHRFRKTELAFTSHFPLTFKVQKEVIQ
jgi:hypothetical protein